MLQTSKYRSELRIVRRSISSRQSFEKRTFDIVVAIAGLLILSPLILLISAGIKIESAGSVFCRHKRYSGEMSIVGTHLFTNAPGKPFLLLDLHEAKPGLVSLQHANGDRCQIADAPMSSDRCIDCDLYYVENRSFFLDMEILFHTFLSKTTYL